MVVAIQIDLSKQKHVLAAYEKDAAGNVGIEAGCGGCGGDEDPFGCGLEDKVCYGCEILVAAFVDYYSFRGEGTWARWVDGNVPNWSQLRRTPISFLPSRRETMSFSKGLVSYGY